MSSEDIQIESPTSETKKSLPARKPIFLDETVEEARFSILMEESTRRGYVAGAQSVQPPVSATPIEPADPPTAPTAIVEGVYNDVLPLYRSNFGFMFLVHMRLFKVAMFILIITIACTALLWVFTELSRLAAPILKLEMSVDLVTPSLPYLWIPVLITVLAVTRTVLVAKYTLLYTTESGYLVYEKPTIAPLLIFGGTNKVKIEQLGSVDVNPELLIVIPLKTKRVSVDSPSDESKNFRNMRGVKDIELLKRALDIS